MGAAVQYEAGDPESAAETCRHILAEQPGCREASLGLAKALLDQGDVPGASSVLKAQIESTPEIAGLHANLGDLLMKAGDLDSAVKSFRQSLSLNPNCVPAYAGLGTTLRGDADDETLQRIETLNMDAATALDATNPKVPTVKRKTALSDQLTCV